MGDAFTPADFRRNAPTPTRFDDRRVAGEGPTVPLTAPPPTWPTQPATFVQRLRAFLSRQSIWA